MQLDFLETIENTQGEKLVSAVLKYLIINSAIFRDCLIAKIAVSVPPGHAPSFRNGLLCLTEHPTEDRLLGNGFIDLLLCDGKPNQIEFAAAFEVKLWAEFQRGQPAKYVGTLKEMVVKNDLTRVLIIVLAPDEYPDLERHLVANQSPDKPAVRWKWSDICQDLKQVAQEESPSLAPVAKWLLHFLKVRIGAKDLQGTPAAYVGPNVTLGNKYQEDFLYKLKPCLPSAGRIDLRLDKRPPYLGFYCNCFDEQQFCDKIWLGFVEQPNGTIVFGIDTGLPGEANTFRPWDREFQEIPFDAELKTALQWKERLTPELAKVQDRRRQSRQSTP